MQADSIGSAAIAVAASSWFAILIATLVIAIECDGEVPDWLPKRTVICVAVFSFLAAVLMPSTKTLCAVVVVPAIANSEAVQKDFPELYTLAVEKLKEQLAPAK